MRGRRKKAGRKLAGLLQALCGAPSRRHRTTLTEKWTEALAGVAPVSVIVLVLCFLLVPMPSGAFAAFLVGSALLVTGMGMFSLGTEMAMTPIGEAIGAAATRSRRVILIALTGLAVGAFVSIAEPDLTVLAAQVPGVPDRVLILSVALGVGIMLALALLRIVFGIRMRTLLLVSYGAVFAAAAFVPRDFLAVAFDSGGVTTGPMTVPFIMGLGVGVSAIRVDSGAERDSFGLVSLCSVGPILAVMLLGMRYRPQEGVASAVTLLEAADSTAIFRAYLAALPVYLREVALAFAPVLALFAVFRALTARTGGAPLRRLLIGLAYTYIGLVLFLTGVNVGFLPAGWLIGRTLGASALRWLLVPAGMLIGWFIVSAEPAVAVLNDQVYRMTAGAIPKKALSLSLSAGCAVSVGLAMLRVLTGLPVMYLLIPGYAAALLLTFFTPPVYTSIAFDSGGVASGPMTAAFLLPLAMGACEGTGGSLAADAFGVVAMVAMTPLIAIQLLGIAGEHKRRAAERFGADDLEIIELG